MKRAFTLVEILVSIAIFGVVFSIVLLMLATISSSSLSDRRLEQFEQVKNSIAVELSNAVRWSNDVRVAGNILTVDGQEYKQEGDRLTKAGRPITPSGIVIPANGFQVRSLSAVGNLAGVEVILQMQNKASPEVNSVLRVVVSQRKTEIASGGSENGSGSESININGITAYWKLDELSGVRMDSVGSNHLNSDGVLSNFGRYGRAASFKRSDRNYLYAPDSPDLSTGDVDFTVSAWVYLYSKPGGNMGIVSKASSSSNREYYLSYNAGAQMFRFNIYNQSGVSVGVVSSTIPDLGRWYLVIAWHDSLANTVNIQVNNGQVISTPATGAPVDTNSMIHLGTSTGATENFDGRIDEVRFIKRVLTPAERNSFSMFFPPVGIVDKQLALVRRVLP